MATKLKELSTEKLQKKVKMGVTVLVVSWGLLVVAVVVALIAGKTTFSFSGLNAGLLGLAVASLAIGIGIKNAKAELARRNADGA